MARPRWHYVLGGLVILYALYGVVVAVIQAVRVNGWLSAPLMLVAHVVALGCCLLVFRGARKAPLLLTVAIAAEAAAEALAPYGSTGIAFIVVWLVPFRTRLPHTVLLPLLAIGCYLAVARDSPVPADAIFGIAAGLSWAAFLGAILNQLAVTRRQSAALAETKVLAERQRLAREIHDVLAHSLSAQVVHLEGTRMLLENGSGSSVILERVVKAGDMARTGLDETKRAVAALRGDETPLAEQLQALATEFRALTGNPCSVEVSGDPDKLVAEIRLTVMRTAQEALTNVHKHSPGASVRVALRRADGWCSLEVIDSGGESSRTVGNGYGLVGMRERAELIGGNLDAGPVDQGFRVRLRVPA